VAVVLAEPAEAQIYSPGWEGAVGLLVTGCHDFHQISCRMACDFDEID